MNKHVSVQGTLRAEDFPTDLAGIGDGGGGGIRLVVLPDVPGQIMVVGEGLCTHRADEAFGAIFC